MKSKYPDYQSSHRFVIFSLQMQKIEYHHFAQVEVDFGQVHIVWWLSYCQVGEKISVEPCITKSSLETFFMIILLGEITNIRLSVTM